jgi:hypothetical protein
VVQKERQKSSSEMWVSNFLNAILYGSNRVLSDLS